MFNFTKRECLSEEDLEEVVYNSEDSKFRDNRDISSENISWPISFKSGIDDALMKKQKLIFSTQMAESRERAASFFLLLGRWA